MSGKKNEQGLASIVIVGVLVILLALITLGFSRIMDRAVNNSLNNQLSAAASYAAQSGINDAMAYIKGQANPDDVSTTDCQTLLKEPGMSSLVDLSGNGNTKITCLLVNPTPSDLMYQQMAPNGTQVIKATTSDAVDKFMFSWQASNGTSKNLPGSTSFSDTTTWDSAGNVPVLKVSLYPVPTGGKISGIQDNSRTFYLVPGNGGGLVTTIPYSTADGSVEQVACNAKNTGINGLSADYDCNAIIDGLYNNIAPGSYYYVSITPIYNQTDVKIKAVNSQDQSVQFIDVQTVIDSTAIANNATKRLQERVDSNTSGDNVSYTENTIPYYSIRSAEALCKQLELHKSYYNYILNKAPGTCDGSTGAPTVPPTLALSIIGSDGPDAGRRVCSTGVNGNDDAEKTLWGCTSANNPDTPQSPVEQGTVYVNSGATVYWQSTDAATYCNASGGWSGDKNPSATWNGVTASGNQTFPINTVTNFSMQCKGPDPTPTATKTVTAWPPPVASISAPSKVYAGQSFNVDYSYSNVSNCNISGSWSSNNINGTNQKGSGSHSVGTSNSDIGKTYIYTITCKDPIGRTAISTTGPGGTTVVVPPTPNVKITSIDTSANDHMELYYTDDQAPAGICNVSDAANGINVDFYPPSSATSTGAQWIGGPFQDGQSGTLKLSCWYNTDKSFTAGTTTSAWSYPIPSVNVSISNPYTGTSFAYESINTNRTRDYASHISPQKDDDCRDGQHGHVYCFDVTADQGGVGTKISSCNIQVNGNNTLVLYNTYGARWNSKTGAAGGSAKWINIEVGWNSSPNSTDPTNYSDTSGQPEDGTGIKVVCYGDANQTGSATDTTYWNHTCGGRGEKGAFYDDESNNGCQAWNPPPSNPPSDPGQPTDPKPTPNCPAGWSGTFPACVPPAPPGGCALLNRLLPLPDFGIMGLWFIGYTPPCA